MAESRRQTFERFRAMTLEAKFAVILFLLVGIGGVLYGSRGFFFQLEKPFFAQLNYSGQPYLTLDEREAQEIERQKQADTDEDTVNDYDEIYVFGTSPYLVDTDSDGIPDAQEIRLGKDPSCPEGEDCTGGLASIDDIGETPGVLGDITASEPSFNVEFGSLTGTEELKQKIQKTSAGELRQALLSTGVDPLIVERLNDDQLRELFMLAAEDAGQSGIIDQLLSQKASAEADAEAEAGTQGVNEIEGSSEAP